MIKNILQTKS